MKRVLISTALLIMAFCVMLSAGCGSSVTEKSATIEPKLVAASNEFPNADLLVSAESVQACLGKYGLVIIDARTAGYKTSHIPGAINLKYGDYRTSAGLKPVADLESQLSAAGLNKGMKIVIYDDTTAAWGAAGRVFWMLEYLGCKDVHILNGGWDRWVADKRPTESTPNALPANKFISAVNSDVLATKSHIMDRLTAGDATDSNNDFAVVDARTEEEYIGWQFYGEARGGHIPKAVNIPYDWFFNRDKTVLKYQDLKKIFEDRGITPNKEVTANCTAGIRSGYAYFIMRLMGYTRVSNYDASILEWSADPSLPMEKLQKYQMVVNPAWINDLISGKNPQTYPGKGYVILELTSNNTQDEVDAYNAGHIPGAIHLNIRSLNKDYPIEEYTLYNGKLLYGSELQTKIEALGITKDTTVVLYEYYDAVWAARIAWVLLYAGVEDVRILNGAWKAWVDGGFPVETTPHTGNPVAFGAVVPVHPEYRTEIAEIKTNGPHGNGTLALGDTRTWDEYIGALNGYNDPVQPGDTGFIQKGRIPGATWVHDWDWYIHFKDEEAYKNDEGDNRLRSYTEVEQMWKQAGLTKDKKTAFYCGGGYRASLSFLFGYMMGYNVSNYDGSWYEWSFGPNGTSSNPIETGYPGQ